jgi:hypothetical protein
MPLIFLCGWVGGLIALGSAGVFQGIRPKHPQAKTLAFRPRLIYNVL